MAALVMPPVRALPCRLFSSDHRAQGEDHMHERQHDRRARDCLMVSYGPCFALEEHIPVDGRGQQR